MAQPNSPDASIVNRMERIATDSHTSLENLSNLAPGTVHVLTDDSAPIRQQIQDLAAKVNGRAFALLDLESTIDSAGVGPHLVRQLARIALDLWPHWYECMLDVPNGSSAAALTALDLAVTEAGARQAGVNLNWLRRAARSAHESKAPLVSDFSPSVQLAQLQKAVSPSGLVLLLECQWSEGAIGDSVARQMENVAQNSGLTLVLVSGAHPLPTALARFSRLTGATASNVEPDSPTGPTFGPVVGRPHPNSEAERRLYEHIRRTEDLRALFAWNQVLHLSPAATPKVDLVWPEGKLVVEIDGWVDHSTREKFESDRIRDYELLAAGYLVLRVSNSEVLADTERVVEKLRRLVGIQSNKHK